MARKPANKDSDTSRTTAGLVGDLLASLPGERMSAVQMADAVRRHRSGVDQAVAALVKAGAAQVEQDPAFRGRTVVVMTSEQALAWNADAGASVAAIAGFHTEVSPLAQRAAKATREQAQQRREQPLRFGMWSDGALMIDGLGRKQLTLPAVDTGNLVQTLAALPEGALQALCESPLKPSFSLQIQGREYPLAAEQTSDLVGYIEQLPAKAVRAATNAAALVGVQKPGTDNRVHRIETPADCVSAES